MPRKPYAKKFATFIEMLARVKQENIDIVVIYHPQDLGDDYTELMESLNRIADAEVALRILPRNQRRKPDP